jgi:hypothetical protein
MYPGVALAQDGGGAVIDLIVMWSDPFSEEPGMSVVPDASSQLVLSNGDDVVVAAKGPFPQPGETRLATLAGLGAETDSLVSVDAGAESDPRYWLDLFTVAGTPHGAFTLARDGTDGVTITMIMGPVTTFADGLAVAQQVVIVDGEPLFEGVEPLGLQALLASELPALDDVPAGGDVTATEAAEEATQEAADGSGLTDDGSYVSPHHGFVLTWTDAWTFDPAYEAPVTSNVNYDVDEVHLTVDSPQWVWLGFYAGELLPGDSFADFMVRSASPERLALEIDPSAEVVASRTGVNADGDEVGALIIRVTIEGFAFIVYEEYRATDGRAVAAVQLLMLVDDMEPGLEASEDLKLDGSPVITLFTHDEILIAAQARTEL